jgi:SAM-dependent methyltransferase
MAADEAWNHNIHYHPSVLAAVPAGAARALDVGCGDGRLARELRGVVPHVTALDRDEPTLAAARSADSGLGIDYVLGDFLRQDLEPGSFDFVCSIAALHHMDAAAGLRRMADLLRPGGRLAVVGLARLGGIRGIGYLPAEFGGLVQHRVERWRHLYVEVAAPTIWPPPESYASMRRIARATLPGASFRRRLLWRYTLVWEKPAD